jgi:adenylate kinase
VLDAHNVVDTDNGYVEIPLDVFRLIGPFVVIALSGNAESIRARRMRDTGRLRPARTSGQIAEYQAMVIAVAEKHAQELGVPFRLVETGDEGAFTRALLV